VTGDHLQGPTQVTGLPLDLPGSCRKDLWSRLVASSDLPMPEYESRSGWGIAVGRSPILKTVLEMQRGVK
jgi:hypothetical protein